MAQKWKRAFRSLKWKHPKNEILKIKDKSNWQESCLCFLECLFYHSNWRKAMGFAVGSSFNSPPYHSLFPIFSQPFSSHPEFLNFLHRNAYNKKKNRAAMACIRHGNPNDIVFCKRRAILFMSISILPLLKSRAEAVESLAAGELGFRISFHFRVF